MTTKFLLVPLFFQKLDKLLLLLLDAALIDLHEVIIRLCVLHLF